MSSIDRIEHAIQAISKPHDYVLVKLDIDDDVLEQALIGQLAENQALLGLIDELFYEMRVTVPAMHKYLGTFRRSTLKEVYQLFTRLRTIGIRMHSWPEDIEAVGTMLYKSI
jgi:hypothetical protein